MFLQVGPTLKERLLRRTQPYRNKRIVNVIHNMYFTGGVHSFARRFDHLFPHYRDSQGVKKIEVPAQMVALVATAVRFFSSHASTSTLTCNVGVCCRA